MVKVYLKAKRLGPSCPEGFTLKELLVVIAIVAVLAALLLPAISSAKNHANSTVCKNHLRQMGQALQMYKHDNGNKYPYFLGPPGPSYGDEIGRDGRAVGLVFWSSKLYPYCPQNWTNTGYHCPGYKGITTGLVKNTANRFGSYTYNLWGVMIEDKAWTKHFGLGPILYWLV
jgi:prepilin-type N-terminal cleavage/methylation domain-containing protein